MTENADDVKIHRTPDFALSDSYASRTQGFRETVISAKWSENNKSFWHRANNGQSGGNFIFVDVERLERRLAFDHDKLRQYLLEKGVEKKGGELPFAAIDPSDDGKVIRFRTGSSKWQVDERGVLSTYDGELNEETLLPIDKDSASHAESEEQSSVVFYNNTTKTVSLQWVDYDEKARQWVDIKPGRNDRRQTYKGHVWRIVDQETKSPIVSFQALAKDAVAIVEERMRSEEYQRMRHCRGANFDVAIDPGTGLDHVYPNLNLERPHAFKFFIRNHDAWMRDAEGEEKRLTKGGSKDNTWDDNPSLSPNGRYAVEWNHGAEDENKVYHIESLPSDQLQPKFRETKYLKAGHKRQCEKPRMFDLLKKKEIKFDSSLFSNAYDLMDFGWNKDNTEYRFVYNERGHQIQRFIALTITGEVKVIIEETSKTFIDYSSKRETKVLKDDTDELIWSSERDGRNHYYLYDLKTHTLTNQITKGNYIAYGIDRLDSKTRQLWFWCLAFTKGRDPYYSSLARINLDGTGLTILTPENGNHKWNWSPDHKYLITTHSRIDSAPETSLRDAETGQILLQLEEQSPAPLLAAGWTLPERFCAPGRDGHTLIYGLIIRPSNLDPKSRYPILEHIYAGPHDFAVPKSWALLSLQHRLAELGFILVMIDGMGTNWREKSFHDVCYKNLKDAGLPDRIAWIKAAAKTRPWMDVERVGVTGGSAGGQNALAALLWHGDFYKAAVANNGCHDNRVDKQWWSEQWMGWPVDDAYKDSSNVVHARRLRGKLLLIVSELDMNVDPACSMQVVAALNKAHREYEFLFLPGKGHCEEDAYVQRRIRDFLVRELMGGEVPDRNLEEPPKE